MPPLSGQVENMGVISLGQSDLCLEKEDVGLRPLGPNPDVATRYYVRRKERVGYTGQAQTNLKPDVDPLTHPKVTPFYKGNLNNGHTTKASNLVQNSNYQDNNLGQPNSHTLEKQCALAKEMSLTHGEDIQRMMLDMEKRDSKVAAELGIKYVQS